MNIENRAYLTNISADKTEQLVYKAKRELNVVVSGEDVCNVLLFLQHNLSKESLLAAGMNERKARRVLSVCIKVNEYLADYPVLPNRK